MLMILTCPLCCSAQLSDFGTVFERRYEHRPGEDGVITGHEVIVHHSVFKCGNCAASSLSGPGVSVPDELVAGVMRRSAEKPDG